jgi:predicted MFS family arabinose efflux permease
MSPDSQPAQRRLTASPAAFLMCLAFTNMLGFAGWQALLNNFAVEKAAFGWFETGLLQTVREIPGFLAFTAIFWLLWMREQTLGYLSLLCLGAGIALTGYLPTLTGLLVTTFIMSVGFHYFETVNQSLQLQLLPKARAPYVMGQIRSAGAAAQVIAYSTMGLAWWMGWQAYEHIFLAQGLLCTLLTALAYAYFQRFDGPVPQRKQLILRRRYWLYYAMTFMSGARRQLFVAFGGFLLVKKFGYSVTDTTILMLVTAIASTLLAAQLGGLVARFGERPTIMLENVVLIVVFAGYALTDSGQVAGLLYVVDGVFFTLILAQRTYLQKIGDPADMAPTSAVSFTINHIAAVAIPVALGLVGARNPSLIFWIGTGIAMVSLALSFLVPWHPAPGNETVLSKTHVVPAE